MVTQRALSAEQMRTTAERELLRRDKIRPGDVLGVVAGPQQEAGSTNFFHLHTVTKGNIQRTRQSKIRSRG